MQLGQGQAARPGRRRFGRRQPLARGQAPGVGRDLGGDRGRQGGAPPQAGRPELAQQGLRPPGQAPRPVRVARVKQVEAGGQGGGVGLAQGGVLVLPVLRKKGEREREEKNDEGGRMERERQKSTLSSSLLSPHLVQEPIAPSPCANADGPDGQAGGERAAAGDREGGGGGGGGRRPQAAQARQGGRGGRGRPRICALGGSCQAASSTAGRGWQTGGWAGGLGAWAWGRHLDGLDNTRARARGRERASRREWWVWRRRERGAQPRPHPPPDLAFARGGVGKGVVDPSPCNLMRLGAPLAACQHRRPGRVRLGGVKKRNMRRFKKNQSPPSHFHSPSLPSPTPSPLLPHTPMFSRALILALAMGA